jgi:hypothetical protein
VKNSPTKLHNACLCTHTHIYTGCLCLPLLVNPVTAVEQGFPTYDLQDKFVPLNASSKVKSVRICYFRSFLACITENICDETLSRFKKSQVIATRLHKVFS